MHSATAALDSSRGGSIMAMRPRKVRPFSSARVMAVLSTLRQAKASTRRPSLENCSLTCSILARSSGVTTQRSSSTSVAPLVTSIRPPASLWTVDIIFRSESKGISVRRGQRFRTRSSSKPLVSPSRTSAVSVGSPISVSPLMTASLHSRAVRSSGSCNGSRKSASLASITSPPV